MKLHSQKVLDRAREEYQATLGNNELGNADSWSVCPVCLLAISNAFMVIHVVGHLDDEEDGPQPVDD